MPISPSLRDFLDTVWEHRADDDIDIYGLYSGRAHSMLEKGPAETGQHSGVLSKLAELNPKARVQPGTQDLMELMSYDWESGEEEDTLSFWLKQSAELPMVIGALLVSFLHFPKEGQGPSVWRVYLNFFPQHTFSVTKYVVDNIVAKIDGIGNAKVVGPLAAGKDRIVIYARDKPSAQLAIESLRRFQHGSSAFFCGDTVAMTKAIHGLKGVSIGEEPPAARYRAQEGTWIPRNSSFGAFREDIIGLALRMVRPGQGKAGFHRVVEKLFIRFGLDPMKPYKQPSRAYAESLAKYELARLQKESELQEHLQELREARKPKHKTAEDAFDWL